MRRAVRVGRPLIYLIGIDKGLYQALFPVYVTGDSPANLSFTIQADADIKVFVPTHAVVSDRAPAREYPPAR